VKFNKDQFKKETAKVRNSPQLVAIARRLAKDRFNDAKEIALKDFNNHPVTVELENGPSATNTSNTLNGKGNLFSFIGFYAGSKPVEVVRDALISYITFEKNPKLLDNVNGVVYQFVIKVPYMTELESITPLPWEDGRSWLRGIERGISGFGRYIYWKLSKGSRSGTGLQGDKLLREGRYQPTSYLGKIMREFKQKFQ
jgi:hypothetical protein